MTIDELMNKLAAELPDGAQIDVTAELGAGWVGARDWDGNEWMEENTDQSLEDRALAALQWCKDQEPPNAEGRG